MKWRAIGPNHAGWRTKSALRGTSDSQPYTFYIEVVCHGGVWWKYDGCGPHVDADL
jgi:hypothetical protein